LLENQPQKNHQEDVEYINKAQMKGKNDFDLPRLLHVIKKSFPWLFFFLLASISIAFLYIRYTPPKYRSESVIQISKKDNAKRVLQVNNFHESDDIAEEIELLKSPYLLRKAIETMPLKVRYFSEGKILTEERYKNSNYFVSLSILKDSSISGIPIFVKLIDKERVNISYTHNTTLFSETYSINIPIENEHFKIDFNIKNHDEIIANQNTNLIYFSFTNLDELSEELLPGLTVNVRNYEAKTLQVIFSHRNTLICQDVVDAVIKTFNRLDVEKRSKRSTIILNFINSQITTVYDRLRKSENKLQEFRKGNNIQELEGHSSGYMSHINNLTDELITHEIDLRFLGQVEKILLTDIKKIDVYNIIPVLVGNKYETSLSKLFERLYELLVEKEKLLFSLTDDNKAIESLNYQTRIQVTLIQKSIIALKEQLTQKHNTIEEKLAEYDDELKSLPAKEIEYTSLKRQYDADEKFYTLLLEKKTEYDISKAGFTSSNRILKNPTLPKSAISPNKHLIIVVSIFIGILFSICIIIIRYILNNEIITVDDITRLSPVGILGMIPKYKRKMDVSTLLINIDPKSILSEFFRSIRTNLQFISTTPGSKLLTITSTISGEGKTFTAINLGGIIAYSGKKVIILDFDLRKPKIHIGFNAENTKGVSTILIGKTSIDECVNKSDLKNLEFISAGPIPPNPSELILNGNIDKIIEELKNKYDIIIIDTPPVGIVTDGVFVMQKADCPIYVFRSNFSKKNFIQNVNNLSTKSKIKNISVILNDIDTESGPFNYGYYGDYFCDKKKKTWFKRLITIIRKK